MSDNKKTFGAREGLWWVLVCVLTVTACVMVNNHSVEQADIEVERATDRVIAANRTRYSYFVAYYYVINGRKADGYAVIYTPKIVESFDDVAVLSSDIQNKLIKDGEAFITNRLTLTSVSRLK